MSNFVVSLDFELLWGVRDHHDKNSYGANVLGAREAIPKLLDLFDEFGIGATWATVGFLFCENKDELVDTIAGIEELPQYRNNRLSNYGFIDDVGPNEVKDPYYFAASLLEQIKNAPKQRIGTHTFSHFYCLEDGATPASFSDDLAAARTLAKRRGIELESIVFPRNQYSDEYLGICAANGITCYRGNPGNYIYRPSKGADQTPVVRAMRLLDAHSGAFGSQVFRPEKRNGMTNVPASRFLRPRAGALARLSSAHIATVKRGLARAAKTGASYHLWWHPHNFGRNTEENLEGLREVCTHFEMLKDKYGWDSAAMEAVAA